MSGRAPRPLVLVVDDEPDLAVVGCEILESEGYPTVSAGNGREALALLDAGLRPAVIVCDLMMPVLDGFGFLAEYARRPSPRAPVLAVSAFEAYLEHARAAGAAGVLAKPYGLARFTAAVAALAQGQRAAEPGPRPPGHDEEARLRAVADLSLGGARTPPELEAFTRRVARIFDVPICLVSLVDAHAQRWAAACGLSAELAAAGGGPRDESFCTHAVAARTALVVQDAAENPFFAENPFVRQHGFRFYAGVPLMGRLGDALGTLCLVDLVPRGFGVTDLELLGVLSSRVVGQLHADERRRRPGTPAAAFQHLGAWDAELDLLGREPFVEVVRLEALRGLERRWPVALASVAIAPGAEGAAAAALHAALPAAHLARLGTWRLGVAAPRMEPEALRAAIAAACPGATIAVARPGDPAPGAILLQRVEGPLGSAGLAPAGGRCA